MKNEDWIALGYTATVDDLLSLAMGLMGEESKYKRGYNEFVVSVTNMLMADCFLVNNGLREAAGKEPFDTLIEVDSLSDVVPFEKEAVTNLLAHGLAFYLLLQDDENDKANVFNAAYEGNKLKMTRASYVDTVNCYR